jgi:hypothetical protein
MKVDGKRDGAAQDVVVDLKENEADTVAASKESLYEIIRDVEAGLPFSKVRQACAAPLDSLVKLAGRNRDVNMLARLHSVISILETEDQAAGRKGFLIEQVSQIERMLQGRTAVSGSAAKGIITGQDTTASPVDIHLSQAGYCEELLRSLPAIDDREVKLLQERGLLDEERLLNTDALELARIAGISTNTAFEIKNLLRSGAEQRASQEIARRVAELRAINEELSAECERLIAANNTLLTNNKKGNKNLKNQYPVVSEQYDLEVKNFKELQGRVVSARIESNRLSTEISFLREEHQKLLDLVEEKHLLLDDLFGRFNSIRSSFEFINGETGFAEDIVMNVEGLLNKALMQKRSLSDKIASSEESMEKLFSEFNSIVKKGKMEFYRSI